MTKIVFYKWQPGFDKIGFYRLLRKELGYSLATAKQTVDLLMEGKTIKIELTSLEVAEQILRQAEQLGAVGGKVSVVRIDDRLPKSGPRLSGVSQTELTDGISRETLEQMLTEVIGKQLETRLPKLLEEIVLKTLAKPSTASLVAN